MIVEPELLFGDISCEHTFHSVSVHFVLHKGIPGCVDAEVCVSISCCNQREPFLYQKSKHIVNVHMVHCKMSSEPSVTLRIA